MRDRPGRRLGRGAQPLELRRIELEARRHQRDRQSRAAAGAHLARPACRAARAATAEAVGDEGRRRHQVARHRPARRAAVRRRDRAADRRAAGRSAAPCCGARCDAACARSRRRTATARRPRSVEPPGGVERLDGVVGDEGRDQHQVGVEARRDAAVEEQLLDRAVALDAGVDDAVADARRGAAR